jgi:head-tail adaptor
MTIRAGELLARLTISAELLVDLPNGGQGIETIVVVTDTPAAVVPIAATETAGLGAQLATVTHRARIRLPRDAAGLAVTISPAMTATATSLSTGQTRTFQIAGAPDVDGRGRELELLLTERVT